METQTERAYFVSFQSWDGSITAPLHFGSGVITNTLDPFDEDFHELIVQQISDELLPMTHVNFNLLSLTVIGERQVGVPDPKDIFKGARVIGMKNVKPARNQ